jgi:hypothetical protein
VILGYSQPFNPPLSTLHSHVRGYYWDDRGRKDVDQRGRRRWDRWSHRRENRPHLLQGVLAAVLGEADRLLGNETTIGHGTSEGNFTRVG